MRTFISLTKIWRNIGLSASAKKLTTGQYLQSSTGQSRSLPALCISIDHISEPFAMPAHKPEQDTDLYAAPTTVRGMMELNKESFRKQLTLPALKVKTDEINKVMKSLKNIALKRPGVKRVVDLGDEAYRLILLDPFKITSSDSFGAPEKTILEKYNIDAQIHRYDLTMTYENFNSEEILRAVLPEGLEVTTGFSRVGHIAHMNLRDHQLPFKYLIGQVIMDKNPGITSVVNKTSMIDNAYRNFQMEILAGEDNMIAKVKENNITYEFDFSKVYWNPRLSTEHDRIVRLLKPGDVVYDVFAGVGPFAVPAAKKKCKVIANDLNPDSYKWLVHNCEVNKIKKNVEMFNLDGREFILGPLKDNLLKQHEALSSNEDTTSSIHIIMNLPGMAVEFLDAFRRLLKGQNPVNVLPTVHCYSFSKSDKPALDIQQRAENFLGASLEGQCSIHLVRNVSPNKEMMCISLKIPAEVLYGDCPAKEDSAEEPAPKRLRQDEISASTGPQ